MIQFFKILIKKARTAMSCLLMLYCFTLIPLAMFFWMSPKYHLFYYSVIASIALITGWIYIQISNLVVKEIGEKKYWFNVIVPIHILNVAWSFAFIIFPSKFYFFVSKWFAELFSTTEVKVEILGSLGPSTILGSIVFIIFCDLFFIKNIIKYSKKKQTPPNVYKAQQGYPIW